MQVEASSVSAAGDPLKSIDSAFRWLLLITLTPCSIVLQESACVPITELIQKGKEVGISK